MLYVEKAQSNLYNLYVQLHLLSTYQKPEETRKKLDILGKLKGSLSISELSAASGIPIQEIKRCYMKGEADSLRTSYDITALIMATTGFKDIFYRYIRNKTGEKVDRRNMDLYIDNFILNHSNSLRIMPVDNVQNACGYFIASVTKLQATLDTSNEKEYLKGIVIAANKLGKVTDLTRSVSSNFHSGSLFSQYKLFNLVDKWDLLQGTASNGKKPEVIRSLLDVLAYLTDTSGDYIRLTPYIDRNGVFYNSSEDDEYIYEGEVYKSIDFVKNINTHFIDNKGSKYLDRETVYLKADFSGVDVNSTQDKRMKKKTYHRLIHSILDRKHNNTFDFVIDTVKYSNELTHGKYNSNTPLFKSTSGYVDLPPVDSQEYKDLEELFDNKIVFKLDNGEEIKEMILNDESILSMLEVSNTVPIVNSMLRYLSENNLEWYHLKPLYKEHCNKALKRVVSFKDHFLAYKSLRFLKDTPNSFFHDKCEYAQLQKSMSIPVPNFNTIEELETVELLTDFFSLPTKEVIKRVTGKSSSMDISPEDLAEEMEMVYRESTKKTLPNVIKVIKDCVDSMALIQYRYQLYTSRKGRTSKNSYSLFYAMKYDQYVQKINSSIGSLKEVSEMFVSSVGITQEKKYANSLIRNFITEYNPNFHYCLTYSNEISSSNVVEALLTEEFMINKAFFSDKYIELRTILKNLANTEGFSHELDSRYNIDEFNIYRTKSTGELILEKISNNSLGQEGRLIKNVYGFSLKAYEGSSGDWLIDAF